MIYLRDVGTGMVVLLLLKKNGIPSYKKTYCQNKKFKENVVEVDDLSKIDEIIGKPGTGVFDTNITHKAGQVLSDNKRLV